jgi:hypothetical protein
MSDTLTDRVAFCVVKRNCNGPSILIATDYSKGQRGRGAGGDKWECRHCQGSVVLPAGEIPQFRKKIEP